MTTISAELRVMAISAHAALCHAITTHSSAGSSTAQQRASDSSNVFWTAEGAFGWLIDPGIMISMRH